MVANQHCGPQLANTASKLTATAASNPADTAGVTPDIGMKSTGSPEATAHSHSCTTAGSG